MKPYSLAILIILFSLSVASCQKVKNYQAGVDLDKVLMSYEGIVRWGSLEQAYGFLESELLAKTSIPTNLDNIRVTGYETVKRPILLSEDTAVQTAKISYVLRDQQIQRTILDEQFWKRIEDSRNWQRTNPIPDYQ
ncbi:MAG: hypothetical protein GY703_25810 [Gammaproteobacteria bacterium]|nr:hypothetical protein [Gammaproteobacteria bacterium]